MTKSQVVSLTVAVALVMAARSHAQAPQGVGHPLLEPLPDAVQVR